jgi:hypothetical protein
MPDDDSVTLLTRMHLFEMVLALQIRLKFRHICGMRAFPFVCGAFFLISVGNLPAEQLPAMRPALLGTGKGSLINLMDAERLMKKGQTDAIVRFTCGVNYSGQGSNMVTYRGSANARPLAEEAIDKLERATFIPAVYRHEKTSSLLSGTIIYAVISGKPHLRIHLNQEGEHLKHDGDDFISPQPVFPPEDKFHGFDFPNETVSADVGVTLNIDATGKLNDAKLVSESPPGAGFGPAVMNKISLVTFLPAYSHGKPVASTTTFHIMFRGRGRGSHWYNN